MMSMIFKNFRIERIAAQSDNLTVWIDVAGRSVNVFSPTVWQELHDVLDTIENIGAKRIVFRSAKPKGFLAGADLKRIVQIDSDEQIQEFMKIGQVALQRIEESRFYTIALLHGPCLGGGLEFALACRFRWGLANHDVSLGMPETKLGLMPGWGGTQRLPRRIELEQAIDMLLDGDSITLERGMETGLIDRIVTLKEIEEWPAMDFATAQTTLLDNSDQRDLVAELDTYLNRHSEKIATLNRAQKAVFNAVQRGIRYGASAGMEAERTQFFELLVAPETREKLLPFGLK